MWSDENKPEQSWHRCQQHQTNAKVIIKQIACMDFSGSRKLVKISCKYSNCLSNSNMVLDFGHTSPHIGPYVLYICITLHYIYTHKYSDFLSFMRAIMVILISSSKCWRCAECWSLCRRAVHEKLHWIASTICCNYMMCFDVDAPFCLPLATSQSFVVMLCTEWAEVTHRHRWKMRFSKCFAATTGGCNKQNKNSTHMMMVQTRNKHTTQQLIFACNCRLEFVFSFY